MSDLSDDAKIIIAFLSFFSFIMLFLVAFVSTMLYRERRIYRRLAMRAEAAGLSLQSPRAGSPHRSSQQHNAAELGLRLPQAAITHHRNNNGGETPIRGAVSHSTGGFFSPRRLWNGHNDGGDGVEWSPPRPGAGEDKEKQTYDVVGSDYVRPSSTRSSSGAHLRPYSSQVGQQNAQQRQHSAGNVISPTHQQQQQQLNSPAPLQPPPPYKGIQHQQPQKVRRASPSIPKAPSSRVQRYPSPNRSALSSSPPHSTSSVSPPQERNYSPPEPAAAADAANSQSHPRSAAAIVVGPNRRLISPTIASIREEQHQSAPAVRGRQVLSPTHADPTHVDPKKTSPTFSASREPKSVPPTAPLDAEAVGNVYLHPAPASTGLEPSQPQQQRAPPPPPEQQQHIRTAPQLEVRTPRSSSPHHVDPTTSSSRRDPSGQATTLPTNTASAIDAAVLVKQVLPLETPSSSQVDLAPPPPVHAPSTEEATNAGGEVIAAASGIDNNAGVSHRVVTPISLSMYKSSRKGGDDEHYPNAEQEAQPKKATTTRLDDAHRLDSSRTPGDVVLQEQKLKRDEEGGSDLAPRSTAPPVPQPLSPPPAVASQPLHEEEARKGAAATSSSKKPCPFCSVDLRDMAPEILSQSMCPSAPNNSRQSHESILSDLKIIKTHKKQIQAAVKSGDMETGQRLLEQLQDAYGAYLL